MKLREKAGLGLLRRLAPVGSLHITLPGGETASTGTGDPDANLVVSDYSPVSDILKTGLTGFAESYMDGRIETSSLPDLIRWGVANQTAWFEHPIARFTIPVRRVWQRIRPERRHVRVRTMNDHYNLGNEFYEAWLDETMTYSSARFETPDDSLEAAQHNKYRLIAKKAGIQPGMRVLEIGCGWGGFAEYAAGELGATVDGITLSEEQADYARKRMADLGLSDRVNIEVVDFREVTGRYDAVVSIEMIESVDETNWPALFDTIRNALEPGARAAMQIIAIDDSEWERYRSRADFIQQYIFPGGQVPAPKVIDQMAEKAGLATEQVETFRLDYARTLAEWRRRFQASWDSISTDNDLDERFRRMWDLYLSLCEAGFRTGRLDICQRVFAVPNRSSGLIEKISSGFPS